MKLTRVGVDLAKQVFQVHGVDRAERPVWCQRLQTLARDSSGSVSRHSASTLPSILPECSDQRVSSWRGSRRSRGFTASLNSSRSVRIGGSASVKRFTYHAMSC